MLILLFLIALAIPLSVFGQCSSNLYCNDDEPCVIFEVCPNLDCGYCDINLTNSTGETELFGTMQNDSFLYNITTDNPLSVGDYVYTVNCTNPDISCVSNGGQFNCQKIVLDECPDARSLIFASQLDAITPGAVGLLVAISIAFIGISVFPRDYATYIVGGILLLIVSSSVFMFGIEEQTGNIVEQNLTVMTETYTYSGATSISSNYVGLALTFAWVWVLMAGLWTFGVFKTQPKPKRRGLVRK